MGHNAGWLALGAGIAGGADVILIPELPYDVEVVAEAIRQRQRRGSGFSIVAVSEGAMTREDAEAMTKAVADKAAAKEEKDGKKKERAEAKLAKLTLTMQDKTLQLSRRLEELTGLESRVTILGHLQRGGTPSAADRLLATRLGTACADLIHQNVFGVMVAARGDGAVAVPLADVVGRVKLVPPDHPWVKTARDIGVCLGDRV
jgi:6-phosphofructokinase 1